MLDELWQYAARATLVFRQVNDVIIWDNRRVLHRKDDFNNRNGDS
ncbi:MAG: TauD/TfdA family dioxygenase [Pseudomonadales bacterium]|nr:TauD/TfdA family dioxygenase [Pseudomonadales bacterium]MBO7004366.1 TauD/TfdA family dioxygenase [Pseudomonadales bacterium]